MSCDNHITFVNMMQQTLMDHCQSMGPYISENGVTINKCSRDVCIYIYIYIYTNIRTQSDVQMPFYQVDDFIIIIMVNIC